MYRDKIARKSGLLASWKKNDSTTTESDWFPTGSDWSRLIAIFPSPPRHENQIFVTVKKMYIFFSNYCNCSIEWSTAQFRAKKTSGNSRRGRAGERKWVVTKFMWNCALRRKFRKKRLKSPRNFPNSQTLHKSVFEWNKKENLLVAWHVQNVKLTGARL